MGEGAGQQQGFRRFVKTIVSFDRLAGRRHGALEWQHMVDDLDEISEVEIEQDGRRALLRTVPGSTIDPICRALGITLPPVFQEIPPSPQSALPVVPKPLRGRSH